jgi:hypothetical protein
MLSLFRKKSVSQSVSLIVLCAFLIMISGCMNYYKAKKTNEPPKAAIVKLQNDKKFIILHKDLNAWHFTDIVIGEDYISGTISRLTGHEKYKTTKPSGVNRYLSKERSEVLNEVHIYVTDFTQQPDSLVSIPLAAVNKIEVYDPAKGATFASWISPVGAVALFVIILALTKSSCPFIYVTDGSSSGFIGEIYSGAIYPSLERNDYLLLPEAKRGQKEYKIKMTNEMHEIQNTNLIELNVFDHPAGTRVFVDKYGNYQTTGILQAPVEATNLNGENILEIIKDKDTLSYLGDKPGKNTQLKDGIILKFNRPDNSGSAKLVVNAKSSFWLDYVFTRFHELFGKEYDCWVDKQQKVSPKKMKNWMLEQNIPLSVYIEKKGRWQFVDYYNIVGPMAAKEDILSFDISDIHTNYIKIKLEYGTLFWEVDYAAIDYTKNIPVTRRTAQFESAIDNNEKDVKNLMTASDLFYYVMPEVGDAVNMTFSIPEPVNAQQTFILHSKGFYKILLNLTGEQQKRELLPFMRKGHFTEFSNEIFQKQSGNTK